MDALHFVSRLAGFTAAAISLLGLTTSAQVVPVGPAGQVGSPLGEATQAGLAVQRGLAAHGPRLISGEIADFVGEGKITYFNVQGPQATFEMTLTRKGKGQILHVVKQQAGELRQGSDGTRTWNSFGGWFTASAQGHALYFLESQTVRSVQTLLNHQAEGLSIRHRGKSGKAGVVEAEDRRGRKTTYFIDDDTSLVTKLEFVTGERKDAFGGAAISVTDTYVFSDYRRIDGILTPFKIERFIGGIKSEEMQFASVRYNASVKDDAFKP
jgi:hypothetical protein